MATTVGPSRQPGAKNDAFVEAQLERARRRIRMLDLTTALLGLLAGMLAFGLVMALLDPWVSSEARSIAFAGFALAAAVYIGITIIRPLTRRINPYYAARKVEETLPGAKNSVVNWLDLHEDKKLPGAIHQAVSQRAAKDLAKADLDQAVSGKRAGWAGAAAGGLFLVFLVLLFSLNDPPLFERLGRAYLPFLGGGAGQRTTVKLLEPQPPDLSVLAEQAVTFRVGVEGRRPDAVKLVIQPPNGDLETEQPFDEGEWGEWVLTLRGKDIKVPGFFYRVVAGDAATPQYRLTVVPSPIIELDGFSATYKQRPYLNQKFDRIERRQRDLSDYRGTQVTLDVPTNRRLKAGRLEISPTTGKPQTVNAEIDANDPQRMRFRFVLEESGKYAIYFTSTDNESYSELHHFITAKKDEAPTVTLTKPGEDREVAANDHFEVEGKAEDHIGVKELALRMQVVGGAKLPARPYRSDKELRLKDGGYPMVVDYRDDVDLAQLKDDKGRPVELKPGTEIEYWLEAKDNCDFPEPNVGESKHYKITLTKPRQDLDKKAEEKKQAEQRQEEHKRQQDKQREKEEKERQDRADRDRKQQDAEEEKEKKRQEEQRQNGKQDEEKAKEEAKKAAEEKKKEEQAEENRKKAEEANRKQQAEDREKQKGGAKDDKEKQGQGKDDPQNKGEGQDNKGRDNEPRQGQGKDNPDKKKEPGKEGAKEAGKDGGKEKGEAKQDPAGQGDDKKRGEEKDGQDKQGDQPKASGKEGGTPKPQPDQRGEGKKEGEKKGGQPPQAGADKGDGGMMGQKPENATAKDAGKEQGGAKQGEGKGQPAKQDRAEGKSGPQDRGQAGEGKSAPKQGDPTAGAKAPGQTSAKAKGDRIKGDPQTPPEEARKDDVEDAARDLKSDSAAEREAARKRLEDIARKNPDGQVKEAAEEALKKEQRGEGTSEAKKPGDPKKEGPQGHAKGGKPDDKTAAGKQGGQAQAQGKGAKEDQKKDNGSAKGRTPGEKEAGELAKTASTAEDKKVDPKQRDEAEKKAAEDFKQLLKDLKSPDPTKRERANDVLRELSRQARENENLKKNLEKKADRAGDAFRQPDLDELKKDLDSDDPKRREAAKNAVRQLQKFAEQFGKNLPPEQQQKLDDLAKKAESDDRHRNRAGDLQIRTWKELKPELRKELEAKGVDEKKYNKAVEELKQKIEEEKDGTASTVGGRGLPTTGIGQVKGRDGKADVTSRDEGVTPAEYRDFYKNFTKRFNEAQQGAKDKDR